MWSAFILLFAVSCLQAQGKDINDCTVWTLNEYIRTKQKAELAASVRSDFLMRAWFKWRNARDYQKDKFVIPIAKKNGALFGGGCTVSALYRGENGITPATFRRLATRDPFNHIIPAWKDPNIAHGAIASKEYLDYVLKWCYAQIDAGVDGLFMDEVTGAYTHFEGFDDESIKGFAQWLAKKYCDGKGWKPDDARWRETFKIPLDDKRVCPDGTIRSFNYREYLMKFGWACDPIAGDNPLRGEWGFPGDKIDAATYCGYRNDRAWKYICDSIRRYAARRGKKVWINANGLNRYVDFQVQGFFQEWVGRRDRVSTSANFLRRYRNIVIRGHQLAGKEVPVVFFHDWGFNGFPFGQLPDGERVKWMKVYAPEIYAAGGYFCFPVNIAGKASLELIKRYASWFQDYRQIFHGGEWITSRSLRADRSGIALAFYEFSERNQRVVHVINHNFDGDIVPQRGVRLSVPSGTAPERVRWVSPEIKDEKLLEFSVANGAVELEVPRLEGYAAIIIDYEKLPTGDAVAKGEVLLIPQGGWGKPSVNRFVIQRDGSINDARQLSKFLQGNLHPDLRNNPTFIVDYPADGDFIIHVNSVARLGTILEVYLDGKKVLSEYLRDIDGKNKSNVGEYDTDFFVSVPAGRHEIRLENSGGDWMTVDYYVLTNYSRGD